MKPTRTSKRGLLVAVAVIGLLVGWLVGRGGRPDVDVGHARELYARGDREGLRGVIESGTPEAREVARMALDAYEQLDRGLATLDQQGPAPADVELGAALALDTKLAPERESPLRHTLVKAMSTACYQRGVALAARMDYRAACLHWKLGLHYQRADPDLLKAAVDVCTRRGEQVLADAQGDCATIRTALAYAVDGDGLKEKIDATCPSERSEESAPQ